MLNEKVYIDGGVCYRFRVDPVPRSKNPFIRNRSLRLVYRKICKDGDLNAISSHLDGEDYTTDETLRLERMIYEYRCRFKPTYRGWKHHGKRRHQHGVDSKKIRNLFRCYEDWRGYSQVL